MHLLLPEVWDEVSEVLGGLNIETGGLGRCQVLNRTWLYTTGGLPSVHQPSNMQIVVWAIYGREDPKTTDCGFGQKGPGCVVLCWQTGIQGRLEIYTLGTICVIFTMLRSKDLISELNHLSSPLIQFGHIKWNFQGA